MGFFAFGKLQVTAAVDFCTVKLRCVLVATNNMQPRASWASKAMALSLVLATRAKCRHCRRAHPPPEQTIEKQAIEIPTPEETIEI